MSDSQQVVILYVPCSSEDEAAHIASILISERLVACGTIYASRSLFRWERKIADETDFVLWAKTTQTRAADATRRIEALHSYETPCILTLGPESVNSAYASWVRAEVLVADDTAPEA